MSWPRHICKSSDEKIPSILKYFTKIFKNIHIKYFFWLSYFHSSIRVIHFVFCTCFRLCVVIYILSSPLILIRVVNYLQFPLLLVLQCCQIHNTICLSAQCNLIWFNFFWMYLCFFLYFIFLCFVFFFWFCKINWFPLKRKDYLSFTKSTECVCLYTVGRSLISLVKWYAPNLNMI